MTADPQISEADYRARLDVLKAEARARIDARFTEQVNAALRPYGYGARLYSLAELRAEASA